MKAKNPNKASLMTREEFDQIISANEEILRQDPFGTEAPRKQAEAIKKAFDDLMVQAEDAK